ncbi:MAG: hypothetical protein J0L78_16775 [Planctomycetes bacterium]|nr:hypothetical protein [Planctomycetota bacterium]
MNSLRATLLCAVAGFAGCESAPPLTATQIETLETRHVQGSRDEVLRAASAVILDQGYYYTASDHAAGTVTAAKVPSSMRDEYQRNGGMTGPVIVNMVSIWVVQATPAECNLRVQYRDFGRVVQSQERVSRFWNEVQRRVLKDAPEPALPAPASTGATAP